MSGGKGGSQSTSVKIPKWLETAAQGNLARADEVSRIGYTPYYGADVAALTPMQQAAMQNTNQAASAFGMAAPADAMAGMAQPQTFAGGVQGYSSAPMYQQAVDQLQANRPTQYNAIASMFIDPVTGGQARGPLGPAPAPAPVVGPTGVAAQGRADGGSYADTRGYVDQSAGASPYTSFGDMFNGGGAGRSGSTFQGGPVSGALNTVGVRPAGSGGSSSGMGGRK